MSNGASLPPLPKLRPRPDLPGHVYPDVTIIQLIDPDEDDDEEDLRLAGDAGTGPRLPYLVGEGAASLPADQTNKNWN